MTTMRGGHPIKDSIARALSKVIQIGEGLLEGLLSKLLRGNG